MYQRFKARKAAALPLIERRYSRSKDAFDIELIIRNRLPETITVDRISVRRPSCLRLKEKRHTVEGSVYFEPTERREIAPVTSITPADPQHPHAGVDHVNLVFWSKERWSGGVVELEVFVSSNACTISNERIVVKQHVTDEIAANPDAKASSTA